MIPWYGELHQYVVHQTHLALCTRAGNKARVSGSQQDLASSPGPAQLSVAFSMVMQATKLSGAWEQG